MQTIREIFGLIKLGTPIYLAGAVFSLFSYLDKRASPKATKAISSWLRSGEYNSTDVSSTLVELFDKLYTCPLWGWRAILRSFIVSAAATSIAIYFSYHPTFYFIITLAQLGNYQFPLLLAGNIFADYISLYAIRYWLRRSRSPVQALFMGFLVATTVVLAVYTLIDVVRFSLETWSFRPIYFVQGLRAWVETILSSGMSSRKAIFLGAMVVHVWLPLFAASVLIARGLNSSRHVAIRVQWFLKQGNKHPLQAIGFVAASICLIGAAIPLLIFAIWANPK